MQAARASETADASKLMRRTDIEGIEMWLLILEAAVALFLLVFIVWWTASGRKPDRPVRRETPPPKEETKD